MYNGIGLPTPRGSGTNGYVQRNLAFVPKKNEEFKPPELKPPSTYKKPNKEILEHERKRKIELKCVELEDLMERQGYDAEEIKSKVNLYRQSLIDKHNEQQKVDSDAQVEELERDAGGRIVGKGTHEEAMANFLKDQKFRTALNIKEDDETDPSKIFDKPSKAKQQKLEHSKDDDENKAKKKKSKKSKKKSKKKEMTPLSIDDSGDETTEKKKSRKRKHKKSKKHKKKDGKKRHRKDSDNESKESGQISESMSSKHNSKEKKSVDPTTAASFTPVESINVSNERETAKEATVLRKENKDDDQRRSEKGNYRRGQESDRDVKLIEDSRRDFNRDNRRDRDNNFRDLKRDIDRGRNDEQSVGSRTAFDGGKDRDSKQRKDLSREFDRDSRRRESDIADKPDRVPGKLDADKGSDDCRKKPDFDRDSRNNNSSSRDREQRRPTEGDRFPESDYRRDLNRRPFDRNADQDSRREFDREPARRFNNDSKYNRDGKDGGEEREYRIQESHDYRKGGSLRNEDRGERKYSDFDRDRKTADFDRNRKYQEFDSGSRDRRQADVMERDRKPSDFDRDRRDNRRQQDFDRDSRKQQSDFENNRDRVDYGRERRFVDIDRDNNRRGDGRDYRRNDSMNIERRRRDDNSPRRNSRQDFRGDERQRSRERPRDNKAVDESNRPKSYREPDLDEWHQTSSSINDRDSSLKSRLDSTNNRGRENNRSDNNPPLAYRNIDRRGSRDRPINKDEFKRKQPLNNDGSPTGGSGNKNKQIKLSEKRCSEVTTKQTIRKRQHSSDDSSASSGSQSSRSSSTNSSSSSSDSD